MIKYTSRKFLLAFFTLLSATWLVWNGSIADGVYSAVVIATIGAYFTSNVSQKVLTPTDPKGAVDPTGRPWPL
jgi:hypothetical protein